MYRYIFVVIFLGIIGLSVLLWQGITRDTKTSLPPEPDIATMRIEIVDFVSENTDVAALTDEEVRTYYYVAFHTLDPKMALSGTDLDMLTTALDALASSTAASRDVYAQWIAPELLYPLDLLRQFSATEKLRRVMLETPTTDSIHEYHTSLDTLFTRYEESLRTIETFLTEQEALGIIMFWQGATRSAYVREQVASIREAVVSAHENERRRFSCLVDDTHAQCPSLAELRKPEGRVAAQPLNTPKKEIVVSEEIKARAKFFEDQSKLVRGIELSPFIESATPLIVVLTESRCAPNGGTYLMAPSRINTRISNIPGLRIPGLDDIYFYDVWKEQEAHFLPSEPKVPDEHRFILQLNNYYTCVDHGFDVHTALSITAIQKGLIEEPLTTPDNPDEDARRIVEVSQQLASEANPTDTLTATLVDLIDGALYSHGTVWFQRQFGADDAHRLLEYRALWLAKTGYFELAVGMLDDYLERTLFARPDGTPTIDAPWFFITHSNMVSFYQFANATVASHTPSLLESHNTAEETFPDTFKGAILSYEKEVRDIIPSYELLHTRTIGAAKYVRTHLFNTRN